MKNLALNEDTSERITQNKLPWAETRRGHSNEIVLTVIRRNCCFMTSLTWIFKAFFVVVAAAFSLACQLSERDVLYRRNIITLMSIDYWAKPAPIFF